MRPCAVEGRTGARFIRGAGATRRPRSFLWDGSTDAACCPIASTTRADAVVDFVVLLLDRPVKRRRARRLRSAGPRDGFAGRRQIVLIQKMPRRWLAELWGDETAAVVLAMGRDARYQGGKDEWP